MSENETLPEWTESENELLCKARLLKELEKIKEGKERSFPKPAWQRFLETSGGAALITVILGTLGGTWITFQLEERREQRELLLQKAEAMEERAALTHKELLAARLKSVKEAVELAGGVMASGEDLISITGPMWADGAAKTEIDRLATREKKVAVRKQWNLEDAKWRSQRHSVGFLLAVYSNKDSPIDKVWRRAEEAIESYLQCARRYYLENSEGSGDSEVACGREHDSALSSMKNFTDVLDLER